VRLDHLLSKEHSPRLLVGSELAPGSRPSVARWVAHWVEHYCVGLALIFGAGSGLVARGERGSDKTHCWVSETAPVRVPVGWGCGSVSDGTDSRDAPCGRLAWGVGGVGVCCLRTAQWTRASLIVCECKCVRAHGGCLGTKSR